MHDSLFVQDANGTVVELVPVPGLWWDPEDRYGIDPDGRPYSRPERLQANHQPLYRVVYPAEETKTDDPETPRPSALAEAVRRSRGGPPTPKLGGFA